MSDRDTNKVTLYTAAGVINLPLVTTDRSNVNAHYTGLAIAQPPNGSPVDVCSNFTNARVDVFNDRGNSCPAGRVRRPALDSLCAVGIQTIGSRVAVAYAQVDRCTGDEVHHNNAESSTRMT